MLMEPLDFSNVAAALGETAFCVDRAPFNRYLAGRINRSQ